MTSPFGKSQPWVAAFALPVAIQLPLTLIGHYVPWAWLFTICSLLLSSVLGFLVLAKRFRRYALLIGVIYFPVKIAVLVYCSLLLVGYVFNDHI